MSNQELQVRYDTLLRLVSTMRIAQIDHLKFRYPNLLTKARVAEHKLDEFVRNENKLKQSNQKEIF